MSSITNTSDKPKLPNTTFIVNNATEAAWIVDKLKAAYAGQTVLSCLPESAYNSVGFIYTTSNYRYSAKNDLQIEWNLKGSSGLNSYPDNKVYKVSDLMSPLEDGAYQIEQTKEGREWFNFLSLKFLLQGVINLDGYAVLIGDSFKVSQLRKGATPLEEWLGEYGWTKTPIDYGIKKIYQHDKGLPEIGEIKPTKASSTLTDPFKTKYLVKIDSTYTEVYIVPNVKTPNSNPELLRVVDLMGEMFYWVYKSDLYSNVKGSTNVLGDLK